MTGLRRDGRTVRETLEYLSRGVGVSPYGTRVSWLPGQELILNGVLDVSEPRPDRPMHLWQGDETGTDGEPAPADWAAPLDEMDASRCAAAGRLLQSYPSRLVLGAALAGAAVAMGGESRWSSVAHGANAWNAFEGAWLRDAALRLTARVLHGAYYVAGTTSRDPLRQAAYNSGSPGALRELTGNAASPGTYVWPLNVAAGIAVVPGEVNTLLYTEELPAADTSSGRPSAMAYLSGSASWSTASTVINVYQTTYTRALSLPDGFRDTVRDVAGVIRGARSSVGALAAVTVFIPGLGLLLAAILLVVVFDKHWEEAADLVESAGEAGIDPNEAVARLLLGVVAVCDLVDDLEDVEAFFSGDDADIHAEVTGLDRETLVAFAQSLREHEVWYSKKLLEGGTTYSTLEEALVEPDWGWVVNDGATFSDYLSFVLDFADRYYDEAAWSGVGVNGVLTPKSTTILAIPVVRTSDTVRDFYWNDYAAVYEPTSGNAWSNGDAIAGRRDALLVLDDERQVWADLAAPMMQFVGALRLATAIFRELVHCEVPLLVLADLAALTGPLGDAVRAELARDGSTSCLVEILGGTKLSSLLAAVWRQVVLDHLLVQYALELGVHGAPGELDEVLDDAAPGLFELVCWMRTAEQRRVLRLLLGSLDAARDKEPVRTGGLVETLLTGSAGGDLCSAWDALGCEDREALTKLVSELGCEPAFFDEDFDLGQPDDYTGLTDPDPGAEGRGANAGVLSLFDDSPVSVEDVDLHLATGLASGLPPGLSRARDVLGGLVAFEPVGLDTTRLRAGVRLVQPYLHPATRWW